jgi:hypothetical protein
LLSEPSGQLVSEHAHRDVSNAAGGVGDDQADRPIGIIILRQGRARQCSTGQESAQEYRGNDRDEALGSPDVCPCSRLFLLAGWRMALAMPRRAGSG